MLDYGPTVDALISISRRWRFSRWAIVLAAVAHVLLVLILFDEELLWVRLSDQAPPEMEVELVAQAPKPPPKPPQPPPQPALQPPPAEAPPKPDLRAGLAPLPLPPQLSPLPSIPQLMPAPLARRSSTPRRAPANGSEGEDKVVAMTSGPAMSIISADKAERGPHGGKGEPGETLSQSEQDFILAQIVKYWHVDLHVPAARGLVLQATLTIQADGTLASPLNKDDPWNPDLVIAGYDKLVQAGNSYRRDTIEAFLLAIRLCQPLKLPPGGHWPREMTLRFAFDDL